MASAGTQMRVNGVNVGGAMDAVALASLMNRVRAQAAADPSGNPILLFALDLALKLDRDEINLDGLERLVQRLTAEAFADRAERLRHYLGEPRSAPVKSALAALIEQRAQEGGLEEFRAALARSVFGVVSRPIRHFPLHSSWPMRPPNWRPGRPSRAKRSIGRDGLRGCSCT